MSRHELLSTVGEKEVTRAIIGPFTKELDE